MLANIVFLHFARAGRIIKTTGLVAGFIVERWEKGNDVAAAVIDVAACHIADHNMSCCFMLHTSII